MTPFRLGYRVRSTHSRTILSHVTIVTLAAQPGEPSRSPYPQTRPPTETRPGTGQNLLALGYRIYLSSLI